MSFREPEPSEQERVNIEMSRAREAELGRAAEPRPTEHPAPPAEGKWRGVLGRVRGMIAQRRARGAP